ncbi:unnamed protein product [Candidula unifasciata]|uniref:G-protein coupled receptors family 1 profile domain-containing protein n=1 Tax=Candidula unifasciata TaxID=100452 RepID=A0A8S3Z892_9EUPU|nr:unnamed protein product [Candidula unifasciata]
MTRSANVKLAVVVVVILAFAYHIPLYLAYKCPRKWNNATQTEEIHFIRYAVFLVPFLLLLTFNALLLRVLWRSNKLLAAMHQRRDQHEKRLTVMVLSMTAIFFLCELMSAIAFILTSGLNRHSECSHHCVRFTAVADTFVIVNAACNFACYCASGRKFREIFAQMFLRRPPEAFSNSLSGSRSSATIKTKLKKFVKKHTGTHTETHTETQLMSLDGCVENETMAAQLHPSLAGRSSISFLEHHGNIS